MSTSRIQALTLQDENPDGPLASEQRAAATDLIQTSHFQPLNDTAGPYTIDLAIEEYKLVLRIHNAQNTPLPTLVLSLSPYRRLIQDYFLMLESYEEARRHATREKLESIDMARRGIHNEGATLLTERLKDKIAIDNETARRLFTLICALHKTNMRLA